MSNNISDFIYHNIYIYLVNLNHLHPPNTCFCLYQEISHPKNGNNKGICIIGEGGDKNEI